MYAQVDKPKENKSRVVANSVVQKQSCGEPTFQFLDNRPKAIEQRRLIQKVNDASQTSQAVGNSTPQGLKSAGENRKLIQRELVRELHGKNINFIMGELEDVFEIPMMQKFKVIEKISALMKSGTPLLGTIAELGTHLGLARKTAQPTLEEQRPVPSIVSQKPDPVEERRRPVRVEEERKPVPVEKERKPVPVEGERRPVPVEEGQETTINYNRETPSEIIEKMFNGTPPFTRPYARSSDAVISIFMLPVFLPTVSNIELTVKKLNSSINRIGGKIGDAMRQGSERKEQRFQELQKGESAFMVDGDEFKRVSTLFRNPGKYDSPTPSTEGFSLYAGRLGLPKTREMIRCLDAYRLMNDATRFWIHRNIPAVLPFFGTSQKAGGAGQGGERGTFKITFSPALYIHPNSDGQNGYIQTKVITNTGKLDTATIIAFGTGKTADEITFTTPVIPGNSGGTTVTIEEI